MLKMLAGPRSFAAENQNCSFLVISGPEIPTISGQPTQPEIV